MVRGITLCMGNAHIAYSTADPMTSRRVAAQPTLALALMESALENAMVLHLLCFVWTSIASWFMIGCLHRRR